MEFTLRRPDLSDARAIAELHVATWREAYAHLLPADFFTAEHAQMRQDQWRRLLGAPADEWSVRVADAGGHLVGFATAGPPLEVDRADAPRDRQLYSLYVSASHYGTGVGQALLDAVLGTGPAMLWVAAQNPRAIAFYRRNGFDFDGVEKSEPRAPAITDARMVR